jgi:hypothetical protein
MSLPVIRFKADSHLAYRVHAVSRRPCCAVALRRTAWSKRGMGMAWQGKCESDTAALCKSNGKDTF